MHDDDSDQLAAAAAAAAAQLAFDINNNNNNNHFHLQQQHLLSDESELRHDEQSFLSAQYAFVQQSSVAQPPADVDDMN